MAKDGGPAFPASIPIVHSEEQGKDYPCYEEAGMTLRDWFAGQALVGVINGRLYAADTIAKLVYEVADAMLAARSSEQEPRKPFTGSSFDFADLSDTNKYVRGKQRWFLDDKEVTEAEYQEWLKTR